MDLLKKKAREKAPVQALAVEEEEGDGCGRPHCGAGGKHAPDEAEPVNRTIVEIGGKKLSLANLDKDLYPAYGFTKAQILEYYRRIARFMLPHLKDRALTLVRYPEGVDQEICFEKRCPSHRPDWVKTAAVPLEGDEEMTVCRVDDLPTLMWVANLAALELHMPLARTHPRHPRRPGLRPGPRHPGQRGGLRPGSADPPGTARAPQAHGVCQDLGEKGAARVCAPTTRGRPLTTPSSFRGRWPKSCKKTTRTW